MKNKKYFVVGGIVVLVIVLILIIYFRRSSDNEFIYTQKVKEIIKNDDDDNRYAGVVENQETVDIKKDSDKTIAELYVEVGSVVDKGEKLFRYNDRDVQNKIANVELDIENIVNEINASKAEIEALKEGKDPDRDNKIKEEQVKISKNEYEIRRKELEKISLSEEIDNLTVKAPRKGIIKTINTAEGEDLPYIQISDAGNVRIRGSIDEKSLSKIKVKQEVTIKSRNDETKAYKGVITAIQTQPKKQEGENADKMSTYPFFVSVEDKHEMLLGEHVYIIGRKNIELKGIWLSPNYLKVEGDHKGLVYRKQNNKIVEVSVEIGKFNEEVNKYEIVKGLDLEDEIAPLIPEGKEGIEAY